MKTFLPNSCVSSVDCSIFSIIAIEHDKNIIKHNEKWLQRFTRQDDDQPFSSPLTHATNDFRSVDVRISSTRTAWMDRHRTTSTRPRGAKISEEARPMRPIRRRKYTVYGVKDRQQTAQTVTSIYIYIFMHMVRTSAYDNIQVYLPTIKEGCLRKWWFSTCNRGGCGSSLPSPQEEQPWWKIFHTKLFISSTSNLQWFGIAIISVRTGGTDQTIAPLVAWRFSNYVVYELQILSIQNSKYLCNVSS